MFAVIMAGGSGTRFWPASREHLPKQFLRITSERTMIEETVRRVEHFARPDRVFVVVGRAHSEIAGRLLTGTEARILSEPMGRNTAACIGLAALHLKRLGEDEPIVVLPADHFIPDVDKFSETIRAAAEVARSGAIVTLGIAPTRPETGYGYIQAVGVAQREGRSQSCFEVERFVEKPNYETAINYLTSGNFLWNSGIFIFTAGAILSELETCMPELYRGLGEIDEAIDAPAYDEVVERVYAKLKSISIDYGVMEKTSRPIYVFKADFGWSDVGSWQALYELRQGEYDGEGNLLIGEAAVVDAKRNLVYSSTRRRVALLGVEGLVVVDTPDALLVADIDRSQDVKKFPEMLARDSNLQSSSK
ncbi:MAG: mannose-1-phosphate guanylyltransferase [Blastocatellia bacterium]|nr:mannose-1-phosphate guanylyltransferase [Blastocatellia bacterium]